MKILRIPMVIVLTVLAGRTLCAAAQTETILHSFSGNPDGASPLAGLAQGSDSNFYGTTEGGGTNSSGSVFRITPAGSVTILHSFAATLSSATASDGFYPFAGLVQGSNSNFYGTTKDGGIGSGLDDGLGIVFQITSGGIETKLHSFLDNPDGAFPEAMLIQGNDGNFYGTTLQGGHGDGTIFRISSAGSYTNLYSFLGDPDGAGPTAALAQGSDGNFYGTTSTGGTNKVGIVFRISPSGSYTNLHTFGSGLDGYTPNGLVQGSDSNLYGTTYHGGTSVNCGTHVGCGTAFRISPSGVYTTLYSFVGNPDGALPQAGLIQASDGNFYGTTSEGGTNHVGTIFRITPSGNETVLFMFGGYPDDGTSPISGVVQGSDGYLYGTTNLGGTNNYGTVFKFLIPPSALSLPFEITSIVVTNSNSLLITWNTTGTNNIVQVKPGTGASGSYTTNGFTDVTNLVVTTATTNFLDVGAATNKPSRYYRIRSP